MQYTDTRDTSLRVDFRTAVMGGMNHVTGGLYMPESFPHIDRALINKTPAPCFRDIAFNMAKPYVEGEIPDDELQGIIEDAYPFSPKLVPLDSITYVLELFHGPSGCHRDFGIAYLTACLETILQMRESSATILAVTRRETGAVLAQELRGKKRIKAVVVCPKGNVYGMEESDYCWNGGNIYPVEIEGNEEDCRNLVRSIFADRDFSEAHRLTVANTANIGRLLPQAFFYPFAFSRLKGEVPGDMYYALAPGNYSNIVAGLYSWRFALPLNGFFIPATDALTVNAAGDCIVLDSVVPYAERMPADPTDPSNIERLEEVFSANSLMMRNFVYPVKLTDKMVDDAVKELFVKYGIFADRHTGRAYAAAKVKADMSSEDGGAVIIVARDHPCLSADYIRSTTGEAPCVPERIASALKAVRVGKPVISSEAELRSIIAGIA